METGVTISSYCYKPSDENDACFIAMSAGITTCISNYCSVYGDESGAGFIAIEVG